MCVAIVHCDISILYHQCDIPQRTCDHSDNDHQGWMGRNHNSIHHHPHHDDDNATRHGDILGGSWTCRSYNGIYYRNIEWYICFNIYLHLTNKCSKRPRHASIGCETVIGTTTWNHYHDKHKTLSDHESTCASYVHIYVHYYVYEKGKKWITVVGQQVFSLIYFILHITYILLYTFLPVPIDWITSTIDGWFQVLVRHALSLRTPIR